MMYENMISPAMYQDIGTSFAMQPMPMMYGGMYPTYGIGSLKPQLTEDKFHKLENKKQEDKILFKKIAKIVGFTALALLGIKLLPKVFSRFKKSTP